MDKIEAFYESLGVKFNRTPPDFLRFAMINLGLLSMVVLVIKVIL